MRNTNFFRSPVHSSRSASAEIGIQMDRAVRPAQKSLAAAEVRVAEVESVVNETEVAFKDADAAFQRLVSKKASVEEVAPVEVVRREALAAKRRVAKRLASERDLRERADRRLSEAEVYVDYLRLSAEEPARRPTPPPTREQAAMAEALRRAGVDPVSARRAATAPAK